MIGQLVVLAVGVELLFFGSFTCLSLPTATGRNLERYCLRTGQKMIRYLPSSLREQALAHMPALGESVERPRYSPYVPMAPLSI